MSVVCHLFWFEEEERRSDPQQRRQTTAEETVDSQQSINSLPFDVVKWLLLSPLLLLLLLRYPIIV